MRAPLCIVVVAVVMLAGCGSSSHSATTTSGSPQDIGGALQVVMVSLEFSPTVIHAKVGQTVIWTNKDSSPHNVTWVSGPRFKSSRPRMNPGSKFSLRLSEAGTIHYYCTIHPWMKATIVVSP